MWPLDDYSLMSVFPPYDCAITLLSMLQDQCTRDLFGRACSSLLRHVNGFSIHTVFTVWPWDDHVKLGSPDATVSVAKLSRLESACWQADGYAY
jgi:hypothetical protein